jgi:hypothetical protein
MEAGKYISGHDKKLQTKYVMAGGDLSEQLLVPEQHY